MVIVIVLLVLAILLGGIGLIATGLKWLLIIALALLILSVVSGFLNRSRRT